MIPLIAAFAPKTSTLNMDTPSPANPPFSLFSLKPAVLSRSSSGASLNGRVTPHTPASRSSTEDLEDKISHLEEEYSLTKGLLLSMSEEVATISNRIAENKEKLIPLKVDFLTHLQSLSNNGLVIFLSKDDSDLIEKILTYGFEGLSEEEKLQINALYTNNSDKLISIESEFPLDITNITPTLNVFKKIKTIEEEMQSDIHHLSLLRGDGHSGHVTPLGGAIVCVDASDDSVIGNTYKKLEDLNLNIIDFFNKQLDLDA